MSGPVVRTRHASQIRLVLFQFDRSSGSLRHSNSDALALARIRNALDNRAPNAPHHRHRCAKEIVVGRVGAVTAIRTPSPSAISMQPNAPRSPKPLVIERHCVARHIGCEALVIRTSLTPANATPSRQFGKCFPMRTLL